MKQSLYNIVKQSVVFFVFILCILSASAQENPVIQLPQTKKIDSLYREDQFYLGITYNLLKNAPAGFSNDKFSTGLSAGFLRDLPLNKNRNVALAPGLGLTFNNYSQNIAITQTNQTPVYTIVANSNDYSKNKFSQLFVDLPLEFRWRGSTFENHSFWRLHLGFKVSYLLYNRSVYEAGNVSSIITNNKDFNKIQYGSFVSAGYGGVNLYAYYGLNPLFKSAQMEGKDINMKSLNIGLIFYIL